MLLEYNTDTDEGQLHDRAIVLRQRVAGRQLDELTAEGRLSSDTLLTLKMANREIRKDYFLDSMDITSATTDNQLTMTRAEQHLHAIGQVEKLGKDITRAARLSKAKLDSLNDLEGRIIKMRQQLQHSGSSSSSASSSSSVMMTAEGEVNADLRRLNHIKGIKIEKKFKNCIHCNRRILLDLLSIHERNCPVQYNNSNSTNTTSGSNSGSGSGNAEEVARRKALFDPTVNQLDHNIITELATFPPQPPRNCQVVKKGVTFIQWKWDPPIVDGGLVITQYEITYRARITEYDAKKGRFKRWEEYVPSLYTSTWIYRSNPVAQNGFKMTYLRANTEYTHFQIRCYNLRGWSPWVNMLTSYDDKITTNAVEPPSCPLFVNCDKITSSCLYLSWQPPYYDGGLPIIDYIINYTIIHKIITVTERDVRQEEHRSFHIVGKQGDGQNGCTTTVAVIRNLPPMTEISNVTVCAINSGELIGAPGYCHQQLHQTLDCSRHMKLLRELERTTESTEEYIDSSFFTGVNQRFLRVEHMRHLQTDLQVFPMTAEEEEEQKEWMAIKQAKAQQKALEEQLRQEQARLEAQTRAEDQEEDANLNPVNTTSNTTSNTIGKKDSFTFTFEQRRHHYERKIATIERTIADLQKERMSIDKQRIQQTLTMRKKEERLLILHLEQERLKNYRSSVITSNVLANDADMQYNTLDYRYRIDKELVNCVNLIADLKYQVIRQENRRQEIKKTIELLEEQYKDRIAKFKDFENHVNKTMRFMSRLKRFNGQNGNSGSGYEYEDEEEKRKLLFVYYHKLVQHQIERKRCRRKILQLFTQSMKRLIQSAFAKWLTGRYAIDELDKEGLETLGDVLLQQSKTKRLELQDELRQAIAITTGLYQKLNKIELSKEKQNQLISSSYYKQMTQEGGIDPLTLFRRGLTLLYEGDGLAKLHKYELARSCYEGQIILLRANQPLDIKLLAICHGRLGKMFLSLQEGNHALIEFDRQLSLAHEISDKCEESDAFYGLGCGYLSIYDYENAIRYLTIAQASYLSLGRNQRYLEVLYSLRTCYEKCNRQDKINVYNEKIQEAQDHIEQRVKSIHNRLDSMRLRLAYNAAEIELIVNIERMTYRAYSLRQEINRLNTELIDLEEKHEQQDERVKKVENLISAIKLELEAAIASDEIEMLSALVHDQPQVIEIEELKTRLKQRGQQEYNHLILEQQTLQRLSIQIKNHEMEIKEMDELLNLENGELMKYTKLGKPFRHIALCSANAAGNEVTGTATGGYEEFIASEGYNLHFIDYHHGGLNHIILGGDRKHSIGHTNYITALLHDGKYIYSGSIDETIICWESNTYQQYLIMIGHEGRITALAAESNFLISAAADVTMRLWNKFTGECLKVLFGHSKTVLCLEIGSSWLVTGSADCEVRVWKITTTTTTTTTTTSNTTSNTTTLGKKKAKIAIESTNRLVGHTTPITCIRYGEVEVLSGDRQGKIIIWWLKTGEILRQCQVHTGPVQCLQFDSVHIVSGGRTDATVCITDIATGEVLQSLRGHEGSILALAFDRERILSIGGDNTIRYWQWGKHSQPSDKLHILEEGETMIQIAKRYDITVDNLMKWNGILEMRKVHPGMKLIVKKGDPNSLTPAEQMALEREYKRKHARSVINRNLAKLQNELTGGDGTSSLLSTEPINRVHKIAMDIDQFSMGNRMFGKETRDLELFPVSPNMNKDKYNLASRLAYDVENHDNPDALPYDRIKPKAYNPYYITAGNEDEWGEAADGLGQSMLDLMIELLVYEIVLEQKKKLRNKQSVIGRIFLYEKDKAEQEAKQQMLLLEAAAAAAAGAGEEKQDDDQGGDGSGSGSGVRLLLPLPNDPTATTNTATTTLPPIPNNSQSKAIVLPSKEELRRKNAMRYSKYAEEINKKKKKEMKKMKKNRMSQDGGNSDLDSSISPNPSDSEQDETLVVRRTTRRDEENGDDDVPLIHHTIEEDSEEVQEMREILHHLLDNKKPSSTRLSQQQLQQEENLHVDANTHNNNNNSKKNDNVILSGGGGSVRKRDEQSDSFTLPPISSKP